MTAVAERSRANNGLRDFGTKVGEIYLIPLDDIELDGNYRKIDLADPEQRAALDLLKANIAANGVLNAGWARMDRGTIKMTAGQRRLAALRELVAEGHPIAPFMPLKSVKAGAEDTRIAMQLAENIHLDPSPVDNGRAFAQLRAFNWDLAKIELVTGYKQSVIKQCLALVDAPVAVQRMVEDGSVRPAAAIQAAKRHGDGATAVLASRVAQAKAAGKKTVTRTKAAPAPKPSKGDTIAEAAQALFEIVATHTDPESDDIRLPKATFYDLGKALFGEKDARVRALAPA